MKSIKYKTFSELERTAEQNEGLTSTGQYWAERKRLETEEIEAERQYAQTPEEQLKRAERQVRALISMRVDAGLTKKQAQELIEAKAKVQKLEANIEEKEIANFLAEWTYEVTVQRRKEWNTKIQSGIFGIQKVDFQALRAAEVAQGWNHESLKRAVKLYNL